MSFWITILLLCAAEALLWITPATRRSSAHVVIACKSSIIGVLCFLLSDKLLSTVVRQLEEMWQENIEISWWMIALHIGAALISVVLSSLCISRFSGRSKMYTPWLSIVSFVFLLLSCAVITAIFEFAFDLINVKNYRGKWQTIWFELEDKKLAFEFQSIHPYLAEYDYRIGFVREGKIIRQHLFTNCGGKTHFNIYRLRDGRWLFQDKDQDYLVDVTRQQVSRIALFDGKLYAAVIPEDEMHSWFGLYSDSKGTVMMQFGKHKVSAADVTGILDDKIYYGCIKRRFIPVEKEAETPIKRLRIR